MASIDPALLQGFAAATQQLSPLSNASLHSVTTLLRPRQFDSSAWMLQAGQRAQWGFYVVSGLARELYIDARGEEHTRAFVAAGEFTGSLLDLLSHQPSVTWVQALEPTTVLAFSYADFDVLCDEHADIGRLARRVAESLYVRKARREYELLALRPQNAMCDGSTVTLHLMSASASASWLHTLASRRNI